jgi:GDP-D-mannose 3', 5'-epimerase
MKKILITGAGGFIGHHLVNFLKSKGHYVVGVDIIKPEYQKTVADEFHILDLRSWPLDAECFQGVSQVYMLAADMGGVGYINTVNADIVRNNTLINMNTLQSAVESGVEKVFFASSACVYPEFKQNELGVTGLREADAIPSQPDTPYGWEKLFAEQACLSFAKDHDLKVRIARFHNIYGPLGTYQGGREKSPAAICRKVAEAKNGSEIKVWGDGLQQRSYCYIDDCIRGVWKLMESNYSQPINIGSDRLVSINELAKIVAIVANKKISIDHDLSQPQGVRSRNADILLAKKKINWQPEVTLEDGLKITYDWISAQLKKGNK